MIFKQSTIGEILDSEKEMVVRGVERYGHYFSNASEFIEILSTGMIKSIDPHHDVFGIFLSQTNKHLTLALFSALRLHHVQAMMNLRQVFEAGACAAYAIANPNHADFANTRNDHTLDPSNRLTKKRYDWLDQNFPTGSADIKRIKGMINEIGTHANIVTAHNTFQNDLEAEVFHTPFFDYENERFVKADIWLIANVVRGIMDLFYDVNLTLGIIKLQDTWIKRYRALGTEYDRLKTEINLWKLLEPESAETDFKSAPNNLLCNPN